MKEKSASTETVPKKVRKPYQRSPNASTETVPQASVGNRTTLYISEGCLSAGDGGPSEARSMTVDRPRCDGIASSPPAFRCRRAGALSFERWGQVNPDPAPAKRPRRLAALSQARWRTAVDTASNSQRPIVIEALPPNEALLSNAQHADSAQRTVDVSTPHAPTSHSSIDRNPIQ